MGNFATLNYLSQHPTSQKRGTIISTIDRAFSLSHPKYHSKNLELVINTFLNNDYPLDFIFKTINNRIKFLLHKQTIKQNNDLINTNTINKKQSWFTIPYIPGVSDKFKYIIKNLDVKLSFYSLTKLDKFIKVQKDPLPTLANKNVVYKINCSHCDASYVGQTKRKLGTRVDEHRRQINWTNNNISVISEHRLQYNHDFDWKRVQILDTESFLSKRLISEAIYIKLQNNGINAQSDTEFLHYAYASIINKLK